MSRAALLAFVMVMMPEACAKMLGRSDAPRSAPEPAPPPLPVTSATTPPIWTPPAPEVPQPTPAAPVSPELAKARVFAQAGDHKKVRALLEKKLKAGKANREEAALLMEACSALRDRACTEAVKAKHPEVDSP
jgi:hypothetical protein